MGAFTPAIMLTVNNFNLTIDTILPKYDAILYFYQYLRTQVIKILSKLNNRDCPIFAVSSNICTKYLRAFKRYILHNILIYPVKIQYRLRQGVQCYVLQCLRWSNKWCKNISLSFYSLVQKHSLLINLRYRLRRCLRWHKEVLLQTYQLIVSCSGYFLIFFSSIYKEQVRYPLRRGPRWGLVKNYLATNRLIKFCSGYLFAIISMYKEPVRYRLRRGSQWGNNGSVKNYQSIKFCSGFLLTFISMYKAEPRMDKWASAGSLDKREPDNPSTDNRRRRSLADLNLTDLNLATNSQVMLSSR